MTSVAGLPLGGLLGCGSVAQGELDRRSFLDAWSATALVVLVLASYVPAAMALDSAHALPVLLLGAVYLASTLQGARVIEQRPTPRIWALVFGAQLGVSVIAALLAEGRTLLSPVATVSLAVLYLPARWRVGVIGAVAVLITGGMLVYAATPLEALQAIVGLGSAAAFVGAFSHLALSRHRARAELAVANERLRAQAEVSARLAAQEERLRIARDIHDSVGHWLTSAHVHLEAARALAGRDEAACVRAIESAGQASREALSEVRRSVRALRADEGLGAPLSRTLSELVGEAARASGIEASFEAADDAPPLRPEVELALFRVTQEALTNVR
ncbi:MAG: hypothetical protein KC619_01690, partial [Myxococcales bacterium]|nr:hypothetical protein [Myxococcales bacterium]